MAEILRFDPFTITITDGQTSISIDTGEVSQLFQGKVILHPSLQANNVRAFTLGSIGHNGVVNWSFLRGPKHIFQPRTNGCTFDPKGSIRTDTTRIETAPIKVQMQQCVDAWWTAAMEKFLGTGRQIRDLLATEKGRKMFAFIINRVFDSIRNSQSNLAWWGKHAEIDAATLGGYFTGDPAAWADFVEQQNIVKGFHTLVAEGAATTPQWDVDIAGGDVSGNKFTGGANSVVSYFEDLYDASTGELQAAYDAEPMSTPFFVSNSIWQAYKNYLISTYGNIGESYYLLVDGAPNREILMYDGHPVVAMREWEEANRLMGINSHLAYLAYAGVFGIAHDVASIDERSGIGLDITTWDIMPYKGQTFISTDFKEGFGVLDKDLLSRAHITLTP